jgi:integrase
MLPKPLTTKFLDAMKPPPDGRRLAIADGALPGFACRVSKRGRIYFSFRYRIGNQQQRVALGKYPAISLADARDKAREIINTLDKGIDPIEAHRIAAAAHEYTLGEVAEKFFTDYLKARMRRSAGDVERLMRNDLISALGKRPIKSIERRDIRNLLEKALNRARESAAKRVLNKAAEDEKARAEEEGRTANIQSAQIAAGEAANKASQGAGYNANRLLAHARKFFNWAMEQDYVSANPCAGLKKLKEEIARDRVLSDEEIVAVWNACEDTGIMGDVTKLLFLTGARLGEVSGMRWSELDETAGMWRLPRERTKNGREHSVPLPAKARAIILAQARIENCDYVFSTTGHSSYSGFSKFKRALDSKTWIAMPWRMHDIRRTVASGMAALGSSPHVVEAVLNHASGTVSGIAAVYNRYRYENEKRIALQMWADHVDRIINRINSVPTLAAAE